MAKDTKLEQALLKKAGAELAEQGLEKLRSGEDKKGIPYVVWLVGGGLGLAALGVIGFKVWAWLVPAAIVTGGLGVAGAAAYFWGKPRLAAIGAERRAQKALAQKAEDAARAEKAKVAQVAREKAALDDELAALKKRI